MLHKSDLSPVRYLKVCKADGKEISFDEIVKGFEYQKNEFVILDDKDFEKANVRLTHLIDIVEFVNEDEIDIRLYEKPYYLEPNKEANKAYALLTHALTRSKKVGIAKFVLHNREHIGVVKTISGLLVLNILRYAGEIRDTNEVKIPEIKLNKRELDMALLLIDHLTKPFKHDEFRDTYVEELNEVIKAKAEGKMPKAKGKKPVKTQAKNLMLALQESLKRARTKKDTKKSARKAAS